MATFCGSGGFEINRYKNNNFKPGEIKNFYLYFKKFSENGETINKSQFRRSLGILGNPKENFICDRLFELIDRENIHSITFEKYLEFLNLVNYGSYDEKCKHTFDFFDLQKKGKIEKLDFRQVIFSLCLYFSSISTTQVKIREEDIDVIYDEILEKIEYEDLTYENFKTVTIENPEILDFFDIFNNKIFENMMIVIHKQILRRLNGLSKSFQILLEKIQEINKNKQGITLSFTNFIERAIKHNSLLIEGIITSKLSDSQNASNNYFLGNKNNFQNSNSKHYDNIFDDKLLLSFDIENSGVQKKDEIDLNSSKKMFSVAKKINNPLFIEDDDISISDGENSFSDEEDQENETFKKNDGDEDEPLNKNTGNDIGFKGLNNLGLLENLNMNNKKNNEKYNYKDNFNNKNIMVNNINNINNINIVSSDLTNIQNLNNFGNLNLIKKKSSLKLYPGLPPIYNFSKDYQKENHENSLNEFFNKRINRENIKNSVDGKNFNIFNNISKLNDSIKKEKILNLETNKHPIRGKSVDLGINHKNNKSKSIILEKNNPKKYLIEIEENFEIFSPKIIKNKEYLNELKTNGIDLDKCLIISNKSAFMNFMMKLKSGLDSIIYDIDPKEAKKLKRRKGHNMGLLDNKELKKEDFLNSTPPLLQEKGMIHFGNKNVELVLTMMIGIRNSINSIGENPNLYPFVPKDDAYRDFNVFNFVQNNFDTEYHCQFFDYAPKVFFNIRHIYGIKNEDYIKSLGPENFLGNLMLTKTRSLKEMCSAGKSGSFFYYSYDNKYVLKTISSSEFEFFKLILEDYYQYMKTNDNTLIQRFFGLHTMIYKDIKMHFVIMNNVFSTNMKINYKYDLKGSSYSRLSRDPNDIHYKSYDFNIPMKDLDFEERKESFNLSSQEVDLLVDQISSDSSFLASKNINDYSLLIGVHDFDLNKESFHETTLKNRLIFEDKSDTEEEKRFFKRKPFFEQFNGGLATIDKKKIIFIGIIDIFTQYGVKKKMEHFFKGITQGHGISCKPPNEYSDRFKNYMQKFLRKSSEF